jgi:hypothetical protein
MSRDKLLAQAKAEGLAVVEKMDFEDVDMVQDTLFVAFHPDPDEIGEDGELDNRYLALWHIFLTSVGWTDAEYWQEYKTRPHHCPDCGELTDCDGDHVDEEDLELPKIPSPESKLN